MGENIRKILSSVNDHGDDIPERHTNALFFPWSPIDNVDIIGGEKFANSEDIKLSQIKNKETP